MNIAVHIAFYYVPERLDFIRRTLQALAAAPHRITVFVYSNRRFVLEPPDPAMTVHVMRHRFLNVRLGRRFLIGKGVLQALLPPPVQHYFHPYYLTWKNRPVVRRHLDRFDVQLYLEDDLAFSAANLDYWLAYKDLCRRNGYNLGFLRVEEDPRGRRYCTDLTRPLATRVELEGRPFLLNDVNPYCGLWIYDRDELGRFVRSPEWAFRFRPYKIREKSAVGWHGRGMGRYKGTVLPLVPSDRGGYVVPSAAAVPHLSNRFIGHGRYCTVRFPLRVSGAAADGSGSEALKDHGGGLHGA